MSAQPRRDDLEPISPELVLVSSPEDARRARERLPEAPPKASPSVVRTRPAPLERPIRWPEVVEEPPAKKARPRRRGLVLLGIAFLLAFLGGYLVETRWRTHRSQPAAELPTASRPPAATRTSTITGHSAPSTTAAARGATSVSRAKAPTKRSARNPSSTASAGPPAPPAAFVPARSWSWAPSLGARAYVVTFFRSGRVVFRARPRRPRLVLPRTFHFRPGSYRWTVRPVPAAPNGEPIIDGRFVLAPGAAAAANNP